MITGCLVCAAIFITTHVSFIYAQWQNGYRPYYGDVPYAYGYESGYSHLRGDSYDSNPSYGSQSSYYTSDGYPSVNTYPSSLYYGDQDGSLNYGQGGQTSYSYYTDATQQNYPYNLYSGRYDTGSSKYDSTGSRYDSGGGRYESVGNRYGYESSGGSRYHYAGTRHEAGGSRYDTGAGGSRYGTGSSRYDSGGGRYDTGNSGYRDPSGHKYKPIYIPVPATVKKKKDPIITVMTRMYIPGGLLLHGKFKSLKHCEDVCRKMPLCFAGDYDPRLYKCYIHTNQTACGTMRGHPRVVHFKKVPCSTVELGTNQGLVVLGAQLHRGIEQKGISDLKTCLSRCTTSGGGIAPRFINSEDVQVCYGVNFNFASHSCYFFPKQVNDGDNAALCTIDGVVIPRDLVPSPSVVHISLCPTKK